MKNVIITGANGNLGTAVTTTFLDRGYKVIAVVAKEEEIKHLQPHANLEVHAVDLVNEAASKKFIEDAIKANGTIDVALLLVGGYAGGNIFDTSIGDVHAQIALNFDTAYHVAQPIFSHMMNNGKGRIVFIGSRPALQAAAGKSSVAYGLSKSLLFKLAEYMNAEAKGKNVVTTVIAPSTLDTEANRKSMPKANPDDWVKPADLAEILEFVVSDRSGTLREPVLKVYNNA
ncbi:MAG: SDR family NAD(P)-dependent oxidoreductase [Chitinophagaceae bacterium]|nr:SDR family NAD(P)-dependent oxidoreductase [Chitinophagaceae bacterium]